jgi:hypothetical protein
VAVYSARQRVSTAYACAPGWLRVRNPVFPGTGLLAHDLDELGSFDLGIISRGGGPKSATPPRRTRYQPSRWCGRPPDECKGSPGLLLTARDATTDQWRASKPARTTTS